MYLNNLSSCDLVGLSSSLAILIDKNLSLDELVLLGTFFTTLGDNLSLIATKRSIEESN